MYVYVYVYIHIYIYIYIYIYTQRIRLSPRAPREQRRDRGRERGDAERLVSMFIMGINT